MQLNIAGDLELADTLESYLRITGQHSIVLNNVIEKFGAFSIKDYLTTLCANLINPYQKRDDLVEIVYRYAQKLLGDSIAIRTADEFYKDPIVLTANHHGVDYFSHSFQASLMFNLYRNLNSNSLTTVPVFSCGNIPLNNATYPQGMFFYSLGYGGLCALPAKLPIFPDRLKRQLVCHVQAFDSEMVQRADKRLEKMVKERILSKRIKEAAKTILNLDYSDPFVIEQSSYSDQAVLLNNKLWRRIFRSESLRTDLVYLEIEKIVDQLLMIDLKNKDSLIYKIMFEPIVRDAVLNELDGARACWDLNQLKKQTILRQLNNDGNTCSKRSGTIFFWGVNEYGKRIPLYLVSSGVGDACFHGVDEHNNLFQLKFSSDEILAGLRQGRLLPSLFTSYLVISLARGVRLIGSYFQGEYLPNMQKGVVAALRKVLDYHEISSKVEAVEANFYLSGMLPVMAQVEEEFLVPAGPVEIIAGGGLSEDDINKILSVTVQDAHIASLLETVPDFISYLIKTADWKLKIAKESLRALEGRVLIK
jgi:hypothetical protein